MPTRYPRDMTGHGPTPPDAKWPNGARVAVSVVLNLITPSPIERMIWAPVAAGLFACALRVALARP